MGCGGPCTVGGFGGCKLCGVVLELCPFAAPALHMQQRLGEQKGSRRGAREPGTANERPPCSAHPLACRSTIAQQAETKALRLLNLQINSKEQALPIVNSLNGKISSYAMKLLRAQAASSPSHAIQDRAHHRCHTLHIGNGGGERGQGGGATIDLLRAHNQSCSCRATRTCGSVCTPHPNPNAPCNTTHGSNRVQRHRRGHWHKWQRSNCRGARGIGSSSSSSRSSPCNTSSRSSTTK
jgi:hypothetical protein